MLNENILISSLLTDACQEGRLGRVERYFVCKLENTWQLNNLPRQTTQLKYLSTGVIWSHLQFYLPDWESCSNSCGSQVDQFPGGENFATRRN
jgi:hypothetical protein